MFFQLLLDRLELGAVKNTNNQSLSDMMALTVGNLGENMLLQRGVCLKAADGAHIGVYVHKTGEEIQSSCTIFHCPLKNNVEAKMSSTVHTCSMHVPLASVPE